LPARATEVAARKLRVGYLSADFREHVVARQKLAHSIATSPHFNTQRFCRHLETAYRGAWSNYAAGLAPQHFAVK
jgi:predicted O-linked N-acetylglucosamine transferase (SPINDLY family)